MPRSVLSVVAALLLPLSGLLAQIPKAEYAERRDRLVAQIQDGVVLALGAPEPAHDYLSFFQSSPFLYLTGIREPDAALVMVKRGGDATSTLFVQPRDSAIEVWSGRRLGDAGATRLTGLPARNHEALRPALDSLLARGGTLYVVGDIGQSGGEDGGILTADEQFVRGLLRDSPDVRVVPLNPVVDRLRGTKSPAELALIRKAVDITVAAQREAMRLIEPGLNEFEVQALIEYTFRRNGADRPGFASIVASGPNATTLHYNADDRFMEADDVVVMDVGASYRGYSADVTRTVPVDGTFSAEQRSIYEIVRAAQAAAEREARPGAQAQKMSEAAAEVIAAGLARLGLTESATATYDCVGEGGRAGECPQWSLYYMHGLGHGIGLDVHDPDQFYFTGTLAPGSVFTIEPGIYVRENLLEILPETPRNRRLIAQIRPEVQRYANIGVRIEDDYIVTERGLEWISKAPREIAEIEGLMREPYAGPAPRKPEVVGWYSETQ